MSVKVNDQLIPDWAIERQAEALIENLAQSMPGKPREVVQLAALDMAKDMLLIRSFPFPVVAVTEPWQKW